MKLKTLVLGGYGNFGARICRALAVDPFIQLLIGGRDLRRAQSLATDLGHEAQAVSLDLNASDFADQLVRHQIDLVIHTAGPFQQQNYAVAMASAQAGAHYIDLADGRRFVCDFSGATHSVFVAAGRVAVSGASTVPALSSAVVDHLCAGWQRIDEIDTSIAPAQSAPRGKATMAAVLGYCGEDLKVWRGGQWQLLRGWANPERIEFARLPPRLGALCDIPDLELFASRYHVTNHVMFRAALEVGFTQRAFAALAAMRAAGILRQPARLAGLLNVSARAFDFLGSELGGMVLRVSGVNATGQPCKRAWHIAADQNHGPEIPCMAAILLARRLARGDCPPAGAHACMGLLQLADFESEFARWNMVTDTIEESTQAGIHDA
jgi:saccharopine dehydrogenase-like NADP-dependent oxidoreductase